MNLEYRWYHPFGFLFSDSASLTCGARFRGPSNFCAESLGLYGAEDLSRTNLKTTLDFYM